MKTWQRDRLEGGDDPVGLELVVARCDPDLAVQRDANLRRAQDVAGRMKRHLDPVAGQDLAVRGCLDRDVAQSLAQNRRGQRWQT